MKNFRLYISKFLVLLVAIQILNLSIDAQTFQQALPVNTLYSFNEMNSIAEFFTEQIFTKKDTFPESKHHNNTSAQIHKHTVVIKCIPMQKYFVQIKSASKITYASFLPETYHFIYTKKQSPPPKFC